MQDIKIGNMVFLFCQNCTTFCMQQRRILVFCIADRGLVFPAECDFCYFCGQAGERFAVRNSGACAVVEGVGDHGCEYMTGGTVVILGSTGRNLGAGFSGGNVYVLDLDMKQVNPAAATNGALLFEPLDADADKLVHGLVKQHAEETGSAFAKALLDDWENSAKRFTHIVPKHFLAMQKAMKEAEEKNAPCAAGAGG